ncbi:stalk domain-containing protein [Alkalihalophilus marmarensis]|uniref:Cysteine-rich secretory protein family protein n=1 Tax=Alkalihalophilus marmarensis DSM 21297 TaxID=1188261 RepID=U6SKB8_9BACI|nr:stalk domain-containing protein [Alkalihalophilus marmarensis]ERN52038.1 hypothetical protein A33I_18265 [Alkalihalophilus marmarensis DSM 21297]
MRNMVIAVLLMGVILFISIPRFEAYEPINVMMNDYQVDMSAPVQIKDETAMIPMRVIYEELGADVKWDQSSKSVTAAKGNDVITVSIGSHTALLNGSETTLTIAPYAYQQRTYVPLRFVSESLGASVRWDQSANTIYIESHEALTPSAQEFELKVGGIQLADSTETVEQILGTPVEQVASSYSFSWNVYHEGFKQYMQVGLENGSVTALYTNDFSLIGSDNKVPNYTKEQVRSILGSPLSMIRKGDKTYRAGGANQDVFDHKGAYVTVFYDKQRNDQATAIQIVKKEAELEKAGYVGTDPASKISDYERQLFLLTNAVRVREGERALNWNESVSDVARAHSEDMAENKYFNHLNQANESPFDRLDRAGIKYTQAGENLAFSHSDAIYAHEALWNSSGHRSNTLGTIFKQAGVGVAWNGETPYYTINFLNP